MDGLIPIFVALAVIAMVPFTVFGLSLILNKAGMPRFAVVSIATVLWPSVFLWLAGECELQREYLISHSPDYGEENIGAGIAMIACIGLAVISLVVGLAAALRATLQSH